MTDRGFFLVEIEVWKIGDSLPAPKFNIVERPNEYIQIQKGSMNPGDMLKYRFWQQFIEYSKSDQALLKAFPGTDSRNPVKDHWMGFSKGCKGNYHLEALIFAPRGSIITLGCGVWIRDDKELYRTFMSHKEEIEAEIGSDLEWSYKEERKATSIRLKHDLELSEEQEFCNRWMADKLVLFQKVFNRYVDI